MKLIKSLILTLAVLTLGALKAHAITEIVDSGSVSVATATVRCTTGTAVNLDSQLTFPSTRDSFKAELQNQGMCSVWLSFASNVSTRAFHGGDDTPTIGDFVTSSTTISYPIGRSLPIYCKAADACGVNGVLLRFKRYLKP